jgi:hypothetical protein
LSKASNGLHDFYLFILFIVVVIIVIIDKWSGFSFRCFLQNIQAVAIEGFHRECLMYRLEMGFVWMNLRINQEAALLQSVIRTVLMKKISFLFWKYQAYSHTAIFLLPIKKLVA